ncbi:MAG TPA: hypothetical protein DEA08_11810 [Planctomycetes bacterium]|nr:hypothetical protein [Planctomycetota bacterium]
MSRRQGGATPRRSESRSAGALRAQALDLLHDRVGVGPAAAEEPLEEAAPARGDQLAVDEDVELSRAALLDLGLQA